jgi:hypothetical protein
LQPGEQADALLVLELHASQAVGAVLAKQSVDHAVMIAAQQHEVVGLIAVRHRQGVVTARRPGRGRGADDVRAVGEV